MTRIIKELRKVLGNLEGNADYLRNVIKKLENSTYEKPDNESTEVLIRELRNDNERLEAAYVMMQTQIDNMNAELYRLRNRENTVNNQVNTVKSEYEKKITECIKINKDVTEECERLKKDNDKLLRIIMNIRNGNEKEFVNEKLMEKIKMLEEELKEADSSREYWDYDEYCDDYDIDDEDTENSYSVNFDYHSIFKNE